MAWGNPLDMLGATWQINMLEVAWNDDFTHMDVLLMRTREAQLSPQRESVARRSLFMMESLTPPG